MGKPQWWIQKASEWVQEKLVEDNRWKEKESFHRQTIEHIEQSAIGVSKFIQCNDRQKEQRSVEQKKQRREASIHWKMQSA